MDIRTGEVYVGVKNTRVYKGNATCAEDIVFRGLGGNTNANIIMTPAIRPGKNEVIPVCTRWYAVFDDSMSWDEKWAYAFDPGQMVADFVTGVVIGEILDGIMAAIQNRLRSIFANYDAAMREAFESGNYSSLRELDVTRRSCQV